MFVLENNDFDKVKRLESYLEPSINFLTANVNDFRNSERYKNILLANDYYANKNDIKDRKRYYIDRNGNLQEIHNVANSKLSHPFLRKLTNQKVNYLLSKEPTFQTDNEQFAEVLTQYFNPAFLSTLKNLGKYAILSGGAWLQVYYNENGELSFKRIPTEEVIPFWEDIEHTKLGAVIRQYSIIQYKENGEKTTVEKIEYYTKQVVRYYEKINGKWQLDHEKPATGNGHFSLMSGDGERVEMLWDNIPFVFFKYNSDEISLLDLVKSQIDDYDIIKSDNSNNLQDIPNSIKVVKNYDATDKEEFTHNLATFRTMFVDGDGGVETLETPLDTDSVTAHLDRLHKDIYEAGNGVDTQNEDLGNASGVALKFRFADLDGDCSDLATEFITALNNLLWFIKAHCKNTGLGDFDGVDVKIIFNTDGIINEGETIKNLRDSVGLISQRTIIANHPFVTDLDLELEQIKKEQEEIEQKQLDTFNKMNYPFNSETHDYDSPENENGDNNNPSKSSHDGGTG